MWQRATLIITIRRPIKSVDFILKKKNMPIKSIAHFNWWDVHTVINEGKESLLVKKFKDKDILQDK